MNNGARGPAIRAAGLTKTYGPKTVLEDVDLEVRTGERFCLVGHNGSGKSTLLEIVMGMRIASRGEIQVLGRQPRDPQLKSQRAILMDQAVFPYYAKAKEVVWMYALFGPGHSKGMALLDHFELDPNAYIRHMSKGQRQRLGLVLTLLGEPLLVLLDEPTSGLDPQARIELWDSLFTDLRERPERTLFFTSHDMAEAERWSDRVGILHRGRLVAVDTPEALMQTTIGTRRKLTLMGVNGLDTELWQRNGLIRSVARIGDELAIYTDDPQTVLSYADLPGDEVGIRIEKVTLRDAFFQITGGHSARVAPPR